MTTPLKPDDDAFAMLREFLSKRCGNELKDEQAYLIDGRLSTLLTRFGVGSVRELVSRASREEGTPLCDALLDAMTTHETQFFRDERMWEQLADRVLPPMIAGLKGRRGLRVWSAACSTGQEVFSVAMLLEERFPAIAARSTIEASDVSPVVVEQARTGRFADHELQRGLDPRRRARHFSPASGGARLSPELLRRVRFFAHGLLSPAPVTEVDLLFCRNVLSYLPGPSRRLVVARLARTLSAGGVLILGAAESLPEVAPPTVAGFYSKAALLGGSRTSAVFPSPAARIKPGAVARVRS